MSILVDAWIADVEVFEQAFFDGRYTDDEAKAELAKLFVPQAADMAWSVLYDARKHGRRHG